MYKLLVTLENWKARLAFAKKENEQLLIWRKPHPVSKMAEAGFCSFASLPQWCLLMMGLLMEVSQKILSHSAKCRKTDIPVLHSSDGIMARNILWREHAAHIIQLKLLLFWGVDIYWCCECTTASPAQIWFAHLTVIFLMAVVAKAHIYSLPSWQTLCYDHTNAM